jgi:hypothetical protein
MNDSPPKNEGWKTFVLILTLMNTVFIAVLSGLQVDAGIRANNANRDSQYYAALVSAELVQQGHRSSYDFQSFAAVLKATQESLINEFTSLGLVEEGDQTSVDDFHLQSVIAEAKADAAQKFSIFFTDPRYAPDQPDGLPKADLYIADGADIANEILLKQNAAADLYQKWNKRSDAYAAVLTLLAIVFFLLGVAQSSQRMRPFFAVSGFVIMLISIAWTFMILVR